jgi:hypothetical protein
MRGKGCMQTERRERGRREEGERKKRGGERHTVA